MTALWFAVVLWGIVNCLTYMIGHHHKTRGTWRKYPMGRHLFGFAAALLATFIVLALSFVLDVPLSVWIAALVLVNLFLAQRNWMLFTTRWRSTGSEPSEYTQREPFN